MRKLSIERNRFMAGGIAVEIKLDGQYVAKLNGLFKPSFECDINDGAHILEFFAYGKKFCEYHLVESSYDVGLLVAGTMGLKKASFDVIENPEIEARNLERAKSEKAQRDMRNAIDSAFDAASQTTPMNFGYLNRLSNEYVASDYYKNAVISFLNDQFDTFITLYNENMIDIVPIAMALKNFTEIRNVPQNIIELCKHHEYIISDRAYINSVFTGDIGKLPEAFDAPWDGDLAIKIGKELDIENRPARNFNERYAIMRSLMMVDYTREQIELMRKFVIKFSNEADRSENGSLVYNELKRINCNIFRNGMMTDKGCINALPTDVLIAEALRLSSNGDYKQLEEAVSTYCKVAKACNVRREQYDILQNTFFTVKAFSLEKTILLAMSEQSLALTEEQNTRINLLKNYTVSNSRNEFDMPEEDNEIKYSDEGRRLITYDYRPMNWSNQEMADYFQSLSVQGQTTNREFVVDEWNKLIKVNGIQWNADEVKENIEKVFKANFGERYTVISAQYGVDEWSGYEDCIMIIDYSEEKKQATGTYPWVAFVVTGDQFIQNQITLSIRVLYIPEFDSLAEDYVERNRTIMNKIGMIRYKKNPKMNNYIQTMTTLILNELEEWMNESSSMNSLYD